MITTPLWGKFRGTVSNNIDPERRGRIQAMVPDALGTVPTSWALPCVAFAGTSSGVYTVPAVGAAVWVEFEHGDPDYPVWTGGFWGSGSDVPSAAGQGLPTSPSIVLQTAAGHQLVLSDLPGPTGGIQLKTASGAMITINDTGITIDNGKGAKISLSGNSTDVNSGALTVM